MDKKKIKLAIYTALTLISFWIFVEINPWSFNEGGYRTVVTQAGGKQFVQFNTGIYYSGFFAKETVWPNQISVSYQDSVPNYNMVDGSIEVKKISIRFGVDGTTADVSGITQYLLPTDEADMIALHNAHKTPQSLVTKRLAPYTKECLQSAAQIMSSEMHYSGGRAQMSQDFSDQLKGGVYLLNTKESIQYDSLTRENKRVYLTQVQYGKDGQPKRKVSSIKEYGITVADAAITDVDYESKVDQMLAKKIDAATKASVAKQELMTAQQQALTAKAQGEKALVEIEYKQKQQQTSQVVAAETKVKLAEQDKLQQKIQAEAAELEARKIKILADASAYEKQRAIQANGALEQKLEAYVTVQKYWADALGKYQGNITPLMMGNGGSSNGWTTQMDFMNLKALKDLSLDMSNNK